MRDQQGTYMCVCMYMFGHMYMSINIYIYTYVISSFEFIEALNRRILLP